VVVALLKQQLLFVLRVKRFCVLPAVRAGTFTFSQARSESGAVFGDKFSICFCPAGLPRRRIEFRKNRGSRVWEEKLKI